MAGPGPEVRAANNSSVKRWLSILIANPVATVVLGLLLVADFRDLPTESWKEGRSTIGAWRQRVFTGHESFLLGSYPPSPFVVREGGGLRLAQPNEESWDAMTRLIRERPADIAQVQHSIWLERRGWWRPTLQIDSEHLDISPFEGEWSNAELKESRRLAAAYYYRFESEQRSAIALADRHAETILWGGWARNGLALLVALAFAFSLTWVPRTPRWWHTHRRAYRLRQSRCPRCGYSIAHLPEPKCPECGEPLAEA